MTISASCTSVCKLDDHPVVAMGEWSWWDQNLDCNERARKVCSQLPIRPSIWEIAVDAAVAESEERKLSKDIKRGHEFAASKRKFAVSYSPAIQTQVKRVEAFDKQCSSSFCYNKAKMASPKPCLHLAGNGRIFTIFMHKPYPHLSMQIESAFIRCVSWG